MANVNVTYEEMRAAGKQLEAGQAEIEGKLEELKKLIDGLVAGGYVTDSSSKAFETSYTEFNTGAKNVIQGLEGMSKYLDSAATTFETADKELASALKK